MSVNSNVVDALMALLQAIHGEAIALVGGLAVSARSEPRFTRDVDLAVAVQSDLEAKKLIRRLMGLGYRVTAQVEQDASGRLATVRLVPAHGTVICDLLFASSGIEPEVVRGASALRLFGNVELPVASVAHLIALKCLSRSPRRPQDDIDLGALFVVATPSDLLEAEAALNLITSRGFARDKNLVAEFAALCLRFHQE